MLVAVATAQRHHWSTTDELLATLIEVVDRGNRWYFAATAKKGTKVPDPIVIRRPHTNNRSSTDAEADKPKLTRAAMRAMLLGG